MSSKTISHTFKAGYKDVFLASWLKYPNPKRPDILSVDIIKKDFDPDAQTLTATRLIIMKNTTPGWISWILPVSPYLYFLEESKIDMKDKSFTLNTKNLSYSSFFNLNEMCTYSPSHTENEESTDFIQKFQAHVCNALGLAGKIEDYVCETALKNAVKGREIMDKSIERVKLEFRSVEEALGEIKRDYIDPLVDPLVRDYIDPLVDPLVNPNIKLNVD